MTLTDEQKTLIMHRSYGEKMRFNAELEERVIATGGNMDLALNLEPDDEEWRSSPIRIHTNSDSLDSMFDFDDDDPYY